MSETNLIPTTAAGAAARALALFNEHTDLAHWFAWKLAKKRDHRVSRVTFLARVDALSSYALEGLWDAAKRFDPVLGKTFKTYASIRIQGAIVDGFRTESALSRRTIQRLRCAEGRAQQTEAVISAQADGLIAETVEDEDKKLHLITRENPEEALAQADVARLVRQSVATLPRQERELIRRHYLNGERFDLVAAELGLSKSWASRLHTRGLERLRKRCAQVEL